MHDCIRHMTQRNRKFGVRTAKSATLAGLALLLLLPLKQSATTALPIQIMSWGPIGRDWQQTLHITALRMGCSGEPSSCIGAIDPGGPPKVVMSILFKTSSLGYGQQYSALSLAQPALYEVSIDDFISQYQKIADEHVDPAASLNSFIDGLKSRNHRLRFGATIYEDELSSEDVSDRRLPAALRAKFDGIHLFLHYRSHAPQYAQYVQRAKQLFPNAEIIGGIYSYDRISYLPCTPGGQPCSVDEEINYFNQSLASVADLAKNGAISWIELYPGLFGREAQWRNWTGPRICPGRVDACVQNTRRMDNAVAAKIKELLG
jgi:hypothetical protein